MDLNEVERVLCLAMDAAIARGERIVRGIDSRADDSSCGCALQVWAGNKHHYLFDAGQAFGWNRDRLWSFINGFDSRAPGTFYYTLKGNEDAHALGRRLAAKYVDGVK